MKIVDNYWIIPGLPTAEMITPKFIIDTCSAYLRIPIDRIMSKERTREVAWCRHVISFFIKHHLQKLSLNDIAMIMQRDHATILHSVKVVKNLTATDNERKQEVENINKKLVVRFT